jgi:hypothetical protein
MAAVLLSLPYLPFVLGIDVGEGIVGALFVGGASLVAPGFVGVLAVRAGGAPRRFTAALGAAALGNVGSAVLLKVLGVSPGPLTFAVTLGVIVVVAGAVVAARGGNLPTLGAEPWPYAVAVGAFVLAFYAGTSVVPGLEDQDTEVQGTAHGLAHDLEPLCLTNRSTLYFFAHPLLLHVFNASTLVLSGQLPTVAPPYAVAKAEREKLPPEQRARGVRAVGNALRERAPRPDRSFLWFHEVYKPFVGSPALFGTRTPNFVLAAAVAVLLFLLSRRLGASAVDASLVTAAYVTLPEIFVRSGYGGYYALTAATWLAASGLAAERHGGARAGYAAGVLAALSNQKALVLGAAVALFRGATRSFGAALPILLGLAAGAAAFWVYGLFLAPAEFLSDHLLDHGFRRFAGGEVLSRSGKTVYPSRIGVWLEFARHAGWIWTVLAAAGLAAGVRVIFRTRGGVASAQDSLVAVLTLLVTVGAIAFTVTDWRQTKHLSLLVPALSVLAASLLAVVRPRERVALRVAFALAIAWNLTWVFRLARNFESFPMSTVW